ncbi:MAG TPA: HEAT repeat domain-containing protein [Planctomycetota bacterium]|nr:HEAT repeat domain-containing protein [Planctomycetota bacterium]
MRNEIRNVCVFLLPALAALALGIPRVASADTIVLRNGQQLQGRVTIEGDKARIELDVGGTVVVDRGEIANTTRDGPAVAATGEAIAVSPELLARLKAREEVHQLIEGLADEKEPARLKAEAELAHRGREVIPTVRAAFLAAPPVPRRHLLRILAAIGDPASTPKIIELLRNPNEKELHVEAVKALAAIAGHDAVLVLTEFLVNAKDDEVRLECLKALVELGSPFAAPFVVEALRSDALRQAARAAVAQWDDSVLLPYLLPLLDEGTREGRERVATWFARLATPGHAVTLTRVLEFYDDDKDVARVLRGGVTRLHRDFPVVGDIELLAAPQFAIRDHALDALKKLQKDRKKRGNTPRDWRDLRDDAVQPRLAVAPVGALSRALTRDIASDIETSLRTPAAPQQGKAEGVARQLPLPPPVPGAEGRPRDARPLLARLDREQAAEPQTVRLIGVTTAEVSVPGLDPALCSTRSQGALLLSLAGLGEARDTVTSRARRLALHALARSMGLPPCGDASCPSSALYAAADLDAKSSRYCAACAAAFAAAWAAEHDAASFYDAAAGAKLAAIAAKAKTKEAHAAAAYAFERALQPLSAIEQWKSWQAVGGAGPAQVALATKRIELLDRFEKWLARKRVAPTPPAKGRPAAP